eukprot:gene38992-2966_t
MAILVVGTCSLPLPFPPLPGGGTSLSDTDVLKLSKDCLGDKAFMDRFKRAMGDEEIPDPAKDREGHLAFIQRMQERLAEQAADESGRKKVFINICKSPAIMEPMPMTQEESRDSGIQDGQLQFR